MVKKMIAHVHKYCDMIINDNPRLEESINNLKNAKDCERAYEEREDDDEADDISIEVDDNAEQFLLNTNIVNRTTELSD